MQPTARPAGVSATTRTTASGFRAGGRRARWAALVAALSLLVGVGTAAADDIDDRRAAVERQQAQAKAHRETLESELEHTDAALAQAVLDLDAVETRLPAAQLELADAEAEVVRTQRVADQLAGRLTDAQAEEAQISTDIDKSATEAEGARSDLAEMARQAMRGGSSTTSLGIVTGAQDADEFVDEYAVASSAARSTTRSLDALRESESVAKNRSVRLTAIRETIADLKQEADDNAAAAQVARQAAADRKAEIEDLIAEQKAKKAEIEARKSVAQKDLETTEAEQKSLSADLKAVVAEQLARDEKLRKEAAERAAREKAAAEKAAKDAASKPSGGSSSGGSSGGGSSSGGSSGGGSSGGSSGGGASTGRFLAYPTKVPHITSSYGYRLQPVLGIYRLHAGTDFRAYCGTPVYAAAAGTVLYTRYYGGLGNQVLVDHGFHDGASLMTSYNHLTRFAVSPGQRVSQGQVVGYSGQTGGVSTACHLHFEVYVNGSTVDPMTMLR